MSSSEDEKDDFKEIKNLTSPSIEDIRDASRNIASKAIKSPLVRLNCKPKYEKDDNREVILVLRYYSKTLSWNLISLND